MDRHTLKEKYQGRRAVIMGNGPSLNQMDLERFRNENLWISNRGYMILERVSWRPSFYVATDQEVISNSLPDIRHLTEELSETLFFLPSSSFANGDIKDRSNIFWYRESGKIGKDDYSVDQDVQKGVLTASTVTLIAVQFAVYLGFNPLYLIGCDTSYSLQTKATEAEKKAGVMHHQGASPDHFDSSYLKGSSKWTVPDHVRMIADYKVIQASLAKKNVQIYNATVGGQLEVFPRVSYQEIFS